MTRRRVGLFPKTNGRVRYSQFLASHWDKWLVPSCVRRQMKVPANGNHSVFVMSPNKERSDLHMSVFPQTPAIPRLATAIEIRTLALFSSPATGQRWAKSNGEGEKGPQRGHYFEDTGEDDIKKNAEGPRAPLK